MLLLSGRLDSPVYSAESAAALTPGDQPALAANVNARLDRRSWIPRWSRADVQPIGRVGADPEVRFTQEEGERAWARLSLATESPSAPAETPDWHTVIVHDRLAQFAARYVTKARDHRGTQYSHSTTTGDSARTRTTS